MKDKNLNFKIKREIIYEYNRITIYKNHST